MANMPKYKTTPVTKHNFAVIINLEANY